LLLLAKTKAKESGTKKFSTSLKNDLLEDAFRNLIKRKVHALAVLNTTKKFYGFIEAIDIANFVVDLCGEDVITKADFDIFALETWKTSKVRDVMKYPVSRENPFHPMMESQSLLSVAEVLASGVHRVPLLNSQYDLEYIVTQKLVVKFINDNIDALGEKMNMPVKHMKDVLNYVVTISDDQRVIDAFRLIKICKIGGVAVVNQKGAIIGNISSLDIKKIASTARWANRLFEKTAKFVGSDPVYLLKSDTLQNAIHKFIHHKIHRLYIVQSSTLVPVGVVTLTDVLKEVLLVE